MRELDYAYKIERHFGMQARQAIIYLSGKYKRQRMRNSRFFLKM